jgi:large subunit ribosomal protein L6
MSRIGKLPVALPAGVTVSVNDGVMKVKGPKGELAQRVASGVSVVQEGGTVAVQRADDSRQSRSNHGLTRALLNNMVQGVTKGFERKLDIQGVGFKSEVKGKSLVLSLGYSHSIEFPFPPGVTIKDFESDVSKGYPNPKAGVQPERFPTVIQIVPVVPAR